MSLKYNSRAILESKLAVLKCCIGTKAIELSNSIALALGDTACKIQELEILNQYFDSLQCYYPFDCWTLPNCTDTEVLETVQVDLTNANGSTLASWATAGDTIDLVIENVLTGTPVTINFPYSSPSGVTLAILAFFANYVRANSSTLGYTVTNYQLNPGSPATWRYNLAVDNCSVQGTYWGFTVHNSTQDLDLDLTALMENSSTCACEETCCSVKVTPEELTYTLITPQSLETEVFAFLDAGDAGTIQTWLNNGNTINIKVYNTLNNTTVTIPYIYTNSNRLLLYTFIKNYINANTLALGYRISSSSIAEGEIFTITMGDCATVSSGNWGFDIINSTLSSTLSRNFNPDDSSTCAVYSTAVSRAEFIECKENCLTDEQAEKMMRHALSLCECCLDIQIDKEPFN